jgi:hypothetical protein
MPFSSPTYGLRAAGPCSGTVRLPRTHNVHNRVHNSSRCIPWNSKLTKCSRAAGCISGYKTMHVSGPSSGSAGTLDARRWPAIGRYMCGVLARARSPAEWPRPQEAPPHRPTALTTMLVCTVAGPTSTLHAPGDGHQLSQHPKTGHIPGDDAEPDGAAFDAGPTRRRQSLAACQHQARAVPGRGATVQPNTRGYL